MAVTIRAAVLAVCFSAMAATTYGQPRVDPRNMYERILAIVPIVGKGTLEDPKRPLYAPLPSAVRPAQRTGILGFTFIASDDGKFALVELVAQDRAAFRDILADSTVRTFLRGRDQRADIEAAFKLLKRDFVFDQLGKVVVP